MQLYFVYFSHIYFLILHFSIAAAPLARAMPERNRLRRVRPPLVSLTGVWYNKLYHAARPYWVNRSKTS